MALGSNGAIYVADFHNHRVMKWAPGADEGAIVAGGYGDGDAPQQLSSPVEIAIDRRGALYVFEVGTPDDSGRVSRWGPMPEASFQLA